MSTARSKSMAIIRRRAALECEIAELMERIEARTRLAAGDERPTMVMEAQPGFLARLWRAIAALLRRSDAKPATASLGDLAEGAPISTLKSRLKAIRAERTALPPDGDPVRLTAELKDLVVTLLPIALSRRVALNEDERQQLEAAFADHQFHGDRRFPSDLVRAVLAHRPLWLASVLGTPKRIPLDDGLFDLVIFDEASQCDIASALPLFARAKRAVVVPAMPRSTARIRSPRSPPAWRSSAGPCHALWPTMVN